MVFYEGMYVAVSFRGDLLYDYKQFYPSTAERQGMCSSITFLNVQLLLLNIILQCK